MRVAKHLENTVTDPTYRAPTTTITSEAFVTSASRTLITYTSALAT